MPSKGRIALEGLALLASRFGVTVSPELREAAETFVGLAEGAASRRPRAKAPRGQEPAALHVAVRVVPPRAKALGSGRRGGSAARPPVIDAEVVEDEATSLPRSPKR